MPRVRLGMAAGGAALALLCACDNETMTRPDPAGRMMGSGVMASQSRAVAGFSALTVTGPVRVVLQQTGSESLVVSADDNLLPFVRSEVRGRRLYLGLTSQGSMMLVNEVVCRLSVSDLRNVEASGAARLEMSGLQAPLLTVQFSGATTGSASGGTEQLMLEVSGASRWIGADLRSQAVATNVSGTSYALVRASDSLAANVSGISVLEYYGNPAVSQNVEGLSVIRRLGP
jgi:putative autotransporter adhesin-like protein